MSNSYAFNVWFQHSGDLIDCFDISIQYRTRWCIDHKQLPSNTSLLLSQNHPETERNLFLHCAPRALALLFSC